MESQGDLGDLGPNRKRQVIDVYAAHTTDDDGRASSLISVHLDEDGATAAASGKGWVDGKVFKKPALRIGGEVFMLAQKKPLLISAMQKDSAKAQEAVKKKALEKLSDTDKKALGL